MEKKGTDIIALIIPIQFVRFAKLNANVDHKLENAQIQVFIK